MELAGGKRSNAELLPAHTQLWNHIFNHIDSMSLKCAVELGIPDAIHHHGKPLSISNLVSTLNIPPTKAPHLRRLMRMLTHSGIFARSHIDNDGHDASEDDHCYYSHTPVSDLLVENTSKKGGNGASLAKFVLSLGHPYVVYPFQSLSAWFRSDQEEATPFSVHYGCGYWDMTGRDLEFNRVFNQGMASDAKFFMNVILKECRHVFEGIRMLVDVGGGTGLAATAISAAFPGIKCSVLELPQVVNTVGVETGAVKFVAGDMFEYVPPADAIFLKWILHDWNHEECVKILKRCKEAILSEGRAGGKVIIVEQVMGQDNTDKETTRAELYLDMLMMTLCPGGERGESEWRKIFMDAGFNRYKITPALGHRSVIELFP